jgi:hypothetical protein
MERRREARAPDMKRPAASSANRSSKSARPRLARGERLFVAEKRYLALFVAVRRQRVQTSAFVGTPFWTIVKGWRFGW